MISEPPLPVDPRALFADSARGPLSLPLPPGRLIVPEGEVSARPAFWLSDGPAPAGLWERLRAEHVRSGLWPVLLDSADDEAAEYRPWGNGEVAPGAMSSPDDHVADALLAKWWAEYTVDDPADELTPAQQAAIIAPFGRTWPGSALTPPPDADPDRIADGLAEHLVAGHPSIRLGLVAVDRGADAVTAAGWTGPANYVEDTAEISAVLRTWEERFGARVVGVGSATLVLSVAAPPTTREAAMAVAAEHFAFCPDNIWQGEHPYTLAAYAERLVEDHSWTFWWD
ncbi:MAG: DUF4253 domain-containing protein [Saccharothrix sp.]|nr:DUF4253 domain-containing protein [Saccharothrix sp.]